MKNILYILIILNTLIWTQNCSQNSQVIEKKDDNYFEIPKMALKLLADNTIEPCRICVDKNKKKAFAALELEFTPGRIIAADKQFFITHSSECMENEMLLSSYTERERYIAEAEKTELYFPLIVFAFHTVEKHLVGIDKEDYTDTIIAQKINKIGKNSLLKGKIKIIRFDYGDGSSFVYSQKENVIKINCKVIGLSE